VWTPVAAATTDPDGTGSPTAAVATTSRIANHETVVAARAAHVHPAQ
jgi:hypothetical protein